MPLHVQLSSFEQTGDFFIFIRFRFDDIGRLARIANQLIQLVRRTLNVFPIFTDQPDQDPSAAFFEQRS